MFKIAGGLFLGWNLGANDAANIFGAGISCRLIKFSTAVILIAVFVMLGSAIEGPKCMASISKLGALDLTAASICAWAAGVSMFILTILEIPASTSQAIVGAIIGATLVNSMPDIKTLLKMVACWIFTPVGAAIIAYIIYIVADRIVEKHIKTSRHFELFLKVCFIVSGCYGAYALGANNVANTTGVYVNSGVLTAQSAALWGGLAIALGAVTFSKRVMLTVGERITLIGPIGAVIATLAHSITVHIYTQIGVPVSSSQAIVGAIIGIGLVRGIRAVNNRMLIKIVMGWISTPLTSGILAFFLVKIFT